MVNKNVGTDAHIGPHGHTSDIAPYALSFNLCYKFRFVKQYCIFIYNVVVYLCHCRETGENPVRARRREVHLKNSFFLPDAANRGHAIGKILRRLKTDSTESKYLDDINSVI